MRRRPSVLRSELRRLVRDESGVAMVFVLGAFLFLYALCLGVYSMGEQVREKARMQNACDAAAYSASVVQADGLSRMAVVNRAMSWSYVQMTKMQMDYILLRWLELTKQRFNEDERCTFRTKLIRMFSKEAGYHNFQDDWKKLQPLAWWSENVGWYIYPLSWLQFGFTCRDHIHDDSNRQKRPGKVNAAYVGFRRPGDDSKVGHVRLNYPTRDTAGVPGGLFLPATEGDRNAGDKLNGVDVPSLDGAVSNLQQKAYGARGAQLKPRIEAMRNAIVACNAMLPAINAKMGEAMRETAVRTLREHLPRRDDGSLDPDALSDYRWTVAGGVSSAPSLYSAGMGDRVERTSYFSGLHNTEEDEMIFLNMADGLPAATGGNTILGKNRGDVRLVDYFSDPAEQSGGSGVSSASGIAAGLDQWFIRCNPEESKVSNSNSIVRSFENPRGGIVRGYKNANYYDGRSSGSALGRALGVGDGVHRGNYVFDGFQDLSAWSVASADGMKAKFMNQIFGAVKSQILDANKPSKKVHPGHKPKWWRFRKRMAYEAKKAAKKQLERNIDIYWMQLANSLNDHIFNPLETVLNKFIDGLVDLNPDPSCDNRRIRFVDKCENVRDTTGLVSEYEWASAYWFCFWFRLYGMGASKGEYHIPAPMAALHGGVKLKKRGNVPAWHGDNLDKIRTDSYGHGFFCPWYKDEMREFRGTQKGKSRNDYRSTFISIDGDFPETCGHQGICGRRSNFILKGYVRIYGDDKAVYDPTNYVGVPAQPWILNERFFNGGGSIVVGLAKKQRNPFAMFFQEGDARTEALSEPSLYSAFQPPPETGDFIDGVWPGDDSRNRRLVALSAARAGYAPRTGAGTPGAGGRDSVNMPESALSPRRYELRWDSVTDARLGKDMLPSLPDNAGLGPYQHYFEHVGRIGCVCAQPNTTERLKHQWNLCQTDWDGMLLPLREAHARHTGYDSASTAFGGGGRDGASAWEFHADRGALDSVNATVGGLLYGQASWRGFSESGTNDVAESTSSVMPLPSEPGTGDPVDLFRLRRLL